MNRVSTLRNWLRSAARSAGVLLLGALPARLGATPFDFSSLTAQAEGAVVGQNVQVSVPGFEIRLLKQGVPIYQQAFGSWTLGRVAATDSSSKTLTGATLMSLTESSPRPFSLDTRLAEYLPLFNTAEKRAITIRQAFSHTSGLDGSESSWVLSAKNISLQQSANVIALDPLAHAPGSTFDYGGLSMQAAGAVAEVAAEMPFVNLFAERITTPLGMSSTRFRLASDSNPRIAGGIESTAIDFARFMDMLLFDGVDRVTGTRILAAESVRTMLARQTRDDQPIDGSPVDNNRYGVGVWLDQLGQAGPTVDAIAAGARGFHSWIDRSEGLVFTFATDLSSFSNLELLSSMMHAEILRIVPRTGDYDGDGLMDADDYQVWRGSYGASVSPFAGADGDGDGAITAADYTLWRDNASPPPPAISTAVPEASSWLLAMVLLLLGTTRRSVPWAGRIAARSAQGTELR